MYWIRARCLTRMSEGLRKVRQFSCSVSVIYLIRLLHFYLTVIIWMKSNVGGHFVFGVHPGQQTFQCLWLISTETLKLQKWQSAWTWMPQTPTQSHPLFFCLSLCISFYIKLTVVTKLHFHFSIFTQTGGWSW